MARQNNGSWFLLQRDGERGVTEVTRFSDGGRAFRAYLDAEAKAAQNEDGREVVLIQGESENDVRASYPHYFIPGTREERSRHIFENLANLTAS